MSKDTLQALYDCVQILRRERFSGMSLEFRFGIAVERVLKTAESRHMTTFSARHIQTLQVPMQNARMHRPPLHEFDSPPEEALAASGLS